VLLVYSTLLDDSADSEEEVWEMHFLGRQSGTTVAPVRVKAKILLDNLEPQLLLKHCQLHG